MKAFTLPICLLLSSLVFCKEGTYREFFFENEKVKVWKTTVSPDGPLDFHRHECDRVVIPITSGRFLKVEEDGSTSDIIFEKDVPMFLSKDPVDELHADINTESYPVEVFVLELKSE